jgi:tRNA-Thr(GGU) m(6)t(6)A37 methyltransferase TsaA
MEEAGAEELARIGAGVWEEHGTEAPGWGEDFDAPGISKEDHPGRGIGKETRLFHMTFEYRSIGVIHSPFKVTEGMPIQPSGAESVKGTIEIHPQYVEGLKDIEGFSHIILLYHFHRRKDTKLTVIPFLDSQPHGVFATRAPSRPNPIGISTVKLIKIEKNILHIENVDILDGTPLLDIKPHVPEFDQSTTVKIGWLEDAKGKVKGKKSDSRFD